MSHSKIYEWTSPLNLIDRSQLGQWVTICKNTIPIIIGKETVGESFGQGENRAAKTTTFLLGFYVHMTNFYSLQTSVNSI